MGNTYIINMNTTTDRATNAIFDLDSSFVGTEHYMGIAYFWSHEYRHHLRDLTPAKRKKVHAKLLSASLNVSEYSQAHTEIIESVLGFQLKH